MSRLGHLFLAMVLASSTWSCTDYAGLLEIEHLPDEYDLSDGIYGRMWLNPTSIRFQPLMSGSPEVRVNFDFVNIGSEDLYLSSMYFVGDPDFKLPGIVQKAIDEIEDVFPFLLRCDPGCFGYGEMGVGFAIFYQPTSGDQAESVFVLETIDPTSPTLELPISLDPNAPPIVIDPDSPLGTLPLVKPNPIRFDSSNLQSEQTLEVCVNLFDREPGVKITNIEAYGSSFSVGRLSDSEGNPSELPFAYLPETFDSNLVEIIFSPGKDVTEGALRVEFTDSNEEQRVLYVPILFR
jgi:hypothetical protein